MAVDASRPSFTYHEKNKTLKELCQALHTRLVSPLQSRQVTPPVPI